MASVIEFYTELDVDVPDRAGWVDVRCFNPDHDDRHASCSVHSEHGGFRCHACAAKGSAYDAAVLLGKSPGDAAELCKQHGLGEWDDHARGGGGSRPSDRAATVQPPSLTLDVYAAAKGLPAAFLRDLGVTDYKDSRFPQRVLRIPYRDMEGREPALRIRKELHKRVDGVDERFLWRKGSKPLLYGLWRLDACRQAGHVVLVEGESCAQTCWHHGIPALGLPGANSWRDDRDAEHLEGIEQVYVLIEPDTGGEAVLGWLAKSSIRDRAWLVELDGHKDASELHLADPDRFREQFDAALEAAEPWRERAAALQTAESRDAFEECATLARSPRILDVLERDLRRAGLAGEEKLGQIVYLAATSRLLEQIVSVAVKGPSAAGKSYVVRRVLEFVPDSAFHALTGMSERSLAFSEEPLEHRMLVLYEAAGMTGDWASYLIRSLLSEGHLRYEISEKDADGRMRTRLVERPGPTGLIVTTTAVSLHPENETRLISLLANDSREQTARVLLAIAEEDEDGAGLDLSPWHALQRWLGAGESGVTIPYRLELARLVPPAAVRLRRDFGAVLSLIRAHALLHRASRETAPNGRIVATIDDYAVVRELVADLISDQAGATVRQTTRETVEATAALLEEDGVEHVTQAAVSRRLELDKSAGQRRVTGGIADGYLRNLETQKGRPSKLVLGEPLPDEVPILPESATVAGVAGLQGESDPCTPLPPSSNGTAEAEGERVREHGIEPGGWA